MESLITFSSVMLLVFLFLKVPIFAAVLGACSIYFVFSNNVMPTLMIQRMMSSTQNLALLAIPFFVCAGIFMNYTGVTKRIMAFCEALIGNVRGGIAHVTILVATLMGGLSGSGLADAAMEAKMLVPEMRKRGFTNEFSSVLVATAAMITPLIPPGIAMIIYGTVANVSIGKLFVAGIGPGLMLCIMLMMLVAVISKKNKDTIVKSDQVFTLHRLWETFKGAFLPLCLPIVIIGGIRIGAFTPTEAGAVAIVYAVILGIIYRELKISDLITGLKETVVTSGSIMIIISAASAFAWILTRERIPQEFTASFTQYLDSKIMFLIALNLFLLFIGMFIEGNAAMIIIVPLIAPLANHFGIDPIHFAMVVIFNFTLGALSPPVGTLMFVTCSVTKCKISSFIKTAVPFYILCLVALVIITFIPFPSTFLVNLLY